MRFCTSQDKQTIPIRQFIRCLIAYIYSMINKLFKILALLLLVMVTVYALGPRVQFEDITKPEPSEWLRVPLENLDSLIALRESKVPKLKEDNHARISWAAEPGQKSNIAICYLHGFSASQEEGDPVHSQLAERYNANLYLARLYDHGRDDINTFKDVTPQQLIDSANEAIDIASRLGDTLVVVSCSTGGTLSAYLASIRDDIDVLVMYSPNIDIYDKKSHLLLMPWGKQIAEMVYGGSYSDHDYTPEQAQYWNKLYHIDGTFMLRSLLDQTMTERTFSKIDIPVFLGYYYENEENSDHVVSVEAMKLFFDKIKTPSHLKEEVAFITPRKHVLSSHLFSEDVAVVYEKTHQFLDAVLD